MPLAVSVWVRLPAWSPEDFSDCWKRQELAGTGFLFPACFFVLFSLPFLPSDGVTAVQQAGFLHENYCVVVMERIYQSSHGWKQTIWWLAFCGFMLCCLSWAFFQIWGTCEVLSRGHYLSNKWSYGKAFPLNNMGLGSVSSLHSCRRDSNLIIWETSVLFQIRLKLTKSSKVVRMADEDNCVYTHTGFIWDSKEKS